MVGLERGTVRLEDHKKDWRKNYEDEVSYLRDILGEKILEFEHVGSTSVEGLKPKPIIDMVAVVENL